MLYNGTGLCVCVVYIALITTQVSYAKSLDDFCQRVGTLSLPIHATATHVTRRRNQARDLRLANYLNHCATRAQP